ncbi:hypothetical protein niasHT_016517 [Heterodera trifolii]|uniref:Uncharacterized protein n=1 Tax=Heterodera trifolii TaxID=157864 RepID=A0ABD2L481_9BILA
MGTQPLFLPIIPCSKLCLALLFLSLVAAGPYALGRRKRANASSSSKMEKNNGKNNRKSDGIDEQQHQRHRLDYCKFFARHFRRSSSNDRRSSGRFFAGPTAYEYVKAQGGCFSILHSF